MSSHEEVQDKLLDLAYGELSRREMREVQRHVDGCAECRVALARIQGTRRAMAALPPEPAPEKGEGILLAAARQEAAERHRHRPTPILPGWAWGAALGVLSVAAVVAVSFRIAALRAPPQRDEEALIGRARVPEAPSPAPLGDAAVRPESTAPRAQRPAPEPRVLAAPSRSAAEAKRAAAPAELPPAVPSAPPADAAPAAGAPAPQAPPPAAGAFGSAPSRLEAAPPAGLRSRPSRETVSPAPQEDGSGYAENAIARYERLQARGALRSSTRATSDCPGEQRRQIDRDAAGRVIRLLVERADGRVEQFYGADGRLAAVRVTGARSLETLDATSGRLLRTEPRQDAAAARSATEGAPTRPPSGLIERAEDVREDAPPRCR